MRLQQTLKSPIVTNLERTFVISDTHLGHAAVLNHDGRPFQSIKEHDEAITANCIDTLSPGNTLIHLGDVGRREADVGAFLTAMRKHNVRVHLIRGNHDDFIKLGGAYEHYLESLQDVAYVRMEGLQFFFSHYAHRTWRNSHHGSYHVHGHSHGALPRLGRSLDAGVNVIGYAPKPLSWVVEELKDQPLTNHHE